MEQLFRWSFSLDSVLFILFPFPCAVPVPPLTSYPGQFLVPAFIQQATAAVDSFLPVSLLVRNPSPWPIEVDVQVTSRAEGSQTSRSWGDDDSAEPGQIMWSGMPRCEGGS